MKKLVLLSITLLAGLQVNSQIQIDDTVSTGAGYANQVFYKVSTGAETSVPANNWDIAFQPAIMTAGIWINNSISTTGPNTINAYAYPYAAASEANFTAAWDTSGLNSWLKILNPEETWDEGGFNITATTHPNYGWGNYNQNHDVVGDSMYLFVKAGVYKKLWFVIKNNSNKYIVRTANLDGSNDDTDTLDMMPYNNSRNLVYYTLGSGTLTDREPAISEWDLLFTRYNGTFGTFPNQSVTGVLSNSGVEIAKAYPVDDVYNLTDTTGYGFSLIISTIGNNWKSLPNGPPPWVIEDSLAYFVKTNDNQLWKIVFTGFGGSANGNYIFFKELIGMETSVAENPLKQVVLYPNPTEGTNTTLVYNLDNTTKAAYAIYDMAGKMIDNQVLNGTAGLHTIQLPTAGLTAGLYFVNLTVDGASKALKLVVR